MIQLILEKNLMPDWDRDSVLLLHGAYIFTTFLMFAMIGVFIKTQLQFGRRFFFFATLAAAAGMLFAIGYDFDANWSKFQVEWPWIDGTTIWARNWEGRLDLFWFTLALTAGYFRVFDPEVALPCFDRVAKRVRASAGIFG